MNTQPHSTIQHRTNPLLIAPGYALNLFLAGTLYSVHSSFFIVLAAWLTLIVGTAITFCITIHRQQ